jgi:hypothetical protein
MVAVRSIVSLASVLAFALIGSVGMHAAVAVTRDHTPPRFAGLRSATTCLPGPIGGERTSSYRLVWAAAKDNVTRSSRIRYDIYRATSPGRENFSRATYTTRRGATAFATPPLPSTKAYFFVVRARDAAGNRDHNRRERPGLNLCE